MKGARKVFREGEWQEGKATPWLPPEQMRGLPQEWTTKDTSDPDKIHELDAPHIVEALVDEQVKKETAGESHDALEKKVFARYDLWRGPLDQLHVDFIKFKAIRNLVKAAMIFHKRGAKFPLPRVRHLWFPKNKLDPRELRDGKPPPRALQPAHLKDLDLVVDVYRWPARVFDILKGKGVELPDVAQLEAQMQNQRLLVLQ